MAFTYFFRDRHTLELIAQHVIPALKRHMYINVWDAGCATGPEPYSIAIALRENMGPFLFRNVRIYATDIDESGRFGEIIARGVYLAERVKRIPHKFLDRYFTPDDRGSRYQIKEEMRKAVTYQRHDLLSLKPIRDGFGLIVCKNVLLHFTPHERVDVIHMFHRALAEGGYFVVEQTQKLPSETHHLFRQVTGAGQLFQKVSRGQDAGRKEQDAGRKQALCTEVQDGGRERSVGSRQRAAAAIDVRIKRDRAFERVSRYTWFNIEAGGDRVGKARVSASGKQLTIYSMTIYPDYEGSGYGQRAIDLFKEQYPKIVADRARTRARGFWERMGFQGDDRGDYTWQK
jgi:chemotaxis protein methyltransferase CheR